MFVFSHVCLTAARLHLLHDLLWFVVKKMLFFWPLHGRQRGREDTQIISEAQECVSEVHTDTPHPDSFVYLERSCLFFFSRCKHSAGPGWGLNEDGFADS